jgi:hypothetical protein
VLPPYLSKGATAGLQESKGGQIIIFIYKILTESFPLYLAVIFSLYLVVGLARLKPSPAYPIGLRIKKAKAKEKYFSCWALVSRLLFILLTC